MMNLNINEKEPVSKSLENMTSSEQMEFNEAEYELKRDILDSVYDLDKICATYLNQIAIIKCRTTIPKDPLWVHYSIEAWNVNETVKNILDKFRQFFPKIFNYINGFVVLRTKSAKQSCEKWLAIIKDTGKDQNKIDSIFNNNDVKTAKVEDIAQMLDSAAGAYSKFADNANQVKGLKSIGDSDSDKKKLEEYTTNPQAYTTYLDKKKIVDDSEPNKDDKVGSQGHSYKDGGWDDPAKIAKLCEAMDHVVSVLENIKRLQAICDEMVRDLSKEQKGESADKNLVKELNEEKIKFLKKLSKEVLSGMMGEIGRAGSKAANNCRSFCNKYEEE